MDIALKQRLVGASVLIALAVIVLPMLLGGRPDDGAPESQTIELPPQPPELDFETRRYPIGETPAPRQDETKPAVVKSLPAPTPSPAPPPSLDTRPVAGSEAERQPLPKVDIPDREPEQTPLVESSPQEAETLPETPPPAAPAVDNSGRYIVQVASFGAVDNAKRLSQALRDYGYNVMTDSIKSDVGTLHRVRVGPFASESEANSMVTRIRSQFDGIKPRVMDLQPEKTAELTSPSDPLVRWVVQVGSFASAANADNLVARLRLQSLSAYKEAVSRSGSTIYRVRIGPFLQREDAISADKQVRESMSLDGVVMSAN